MSSVELCIIRNEKAYFPILQNEINWEIQLYGSPSKLTFKVLPDDIISFFEGDKVSLKVNDTYLFLGYIFSKKRNKNRIITVTAYDQLRYFKNKDTIKYHHKKASDIIKIFAAQYGFKTGTIEDTEYVITSRLEENKTLYDIILTAIDLTVQNKKKLYVLYDDYGLITLKNIDNMNVDVVVGEDNAVDFDYESSIDGETYNKIKLSTPCNDKKKRNVFIAQDSKHMNEWGILQYFDTLEENENGIAKAKALLEKYNRKKRTVSLKKVIGDIRVRAGSRVIVYIQNLGELSLQSYMMVDKVKHTFKDEEHFMDLTLRGGGKFA